MSQKIVWKNIWLRVHGKWKVTMNKIFLFQRAVEVMSLEY
jgi:hypothetical protein